MAPGEAAEPYNLVASPGIVHAYCTEDQIKRILSSFYTKA